MSNKYPDPYPEPDSLTPARGIILGVVLGTAGLSAIAATAFTINLLF